MLNFWVYFCFYSINLCFEVHAFVKCVWCCIFFDCLELICLKKELKKLYPEYISFAFGDQLNDIPMLKEADFGVAVNNAKQAVKDIADYITEYDCDNLGVLRFLEKVIE